MDFSLSICKIILVTIALTWINTFKPCQAQAIVGKWKMISGTNYFSLLNNILKMILTKRTVHLGFVYAWVGWMIIMLPAQSTAQPKNNAFGDSIPISNGLMGKIYLLPDTTTMLPEFDTMPALKTMIYTKSLDIPDRDWSEGFPGLRGRFEYFGIRYKGNFQVLKEGSYNFRLISDDGSKLIIDDSMVIDNDGIHGDNAQNGNIFLKKGMHDFRLDYFQGPRFEIALQLFYSRDSTEEQIFPGNMFILFTPKPRHLCPWLILLLIIILFVTGWIWRKRYQKRIATNGNK